MITNELISLDGIKAALDSGASDLDKTAKEEGIVKDEEKKTEVCREVVFNALLCTDGYNYRMFPLLPRVRQQHLPSLGRVLLR